MRGYKKMKKRILICGVVLMLLLQGCGGVPQEEYDNLVKANEELSGELESLKTEYEKVNSSYEKLGGEYETLKTEYEKINSSYIELVDETVKENMKLSFPKAWATTCFGENCIVLPENSEYLQIIAEEKYALSNDGVKAVWKKMLEACAILGQFKDNINYNKISIKFLMEDGKEMLEFILIRKNGNYELESIIGSLFDATTLVPALQGLVK